MNKLQNDRKSRLKLSRNRYEKFVKDGKIYRYDRLNHRVSADSESSVPAEKNRAHEFSHAVFAVSSGGFVGEIAAERIGHSLKFATKTVWLKENKTRKIEFYYAGIAMNMFLCGFSAFLFCFCEHVLTVFGFAANLVFVLINSFPCDGSDGLKMLDMFLKRK